MRYLLYQLEPVTDLTGAVVSLPKSVDVYQLPDYEQNRV